MESVIELSWHNVILWLLDIFTTAGRHGTLDCCHQVAPWHLTPVGFLYPIVNTALCIINILTEILQQFIFYFQQT